MTQIFHNIISATLGISEKQIGQTLHLLNDGATIPFISRYRKEATGGLDEVQIEAIQTQYEKLNEIAKRKETIINTIREQEKMTPELQKRIDETWDSTCLLYTSTVIHSTNIHSPGYPSEIIRLAVCVCVPLSSIITVAVSVLDRAIY